MPGGARVASWLASERSGSLPGVKVRTCHWLLAGKASAARSGSNPARTSEDLPLPEAPTRATKGYSASLWASRWRSSSRPK